MPHIRSALDQLFMRKHEQSLSQASSHAQSFSDSSIVHDMLGLSSKRTILNETFAQPAKNCQNGSYDGGISKPLRFSSPMREMKSKKLPKI
jgi:hypothetical protein